MTRFGRSRMLCKRQYRISFSDILILMKKELFVTPLRVPYVQSGHVRGVSWGKI